MVPLIHIVNVFSLGTIELTPNSQCQVGNIFLLLISFKNINEEDIEPYVVETVSICEETRIKFSSASGKYLGVTLNSTCFKSEYKRVFPLKRPLDRRFAPISV